MSTYDDKSDVDERKGEGIGSPSMTRMSTRLGTVVVDDALYKLAGKDAEAASMDIVLLHGLKPIGSTDEAYAETFRPSGAEGLPELMAGLYPGARVLSVKYDSKPGAKNSIEENADYVRTTLLKGGVGKRPLVLIGHSLGGIVIKAVIKSAYDKFGTAETIRNQELLTQLKAVVFIATPHAGATLADYLKYAKDGPQVQILRPFSEAASRLQTSFETLRNPESASAPLRKLPVLALREMTDYSVPVIGRLGAKVKVVEMASATANGVSWVCEPIELDHVAIAKAGGKSHPTYMSIKSFLSDHVEQTPTGEEWPSVVKYRGGEVFGEFSDLGYGTWQEVGTDERIWYEVRREDGVVTVKDPRRIYGDKEIHVDIDFNEGALRMREPDSIDAVVNVRYRWVAHILNFPPRQQLPPADPEAITSVRYAAGHIRGRFSREQGSRSWIEYNTDIQTGEPVRMVNSFKLVWAQDGWLLLEDQERRWPNGESLYLDIHLKDQWAGVREEAFPVPLNYAPLLYTPRGEALERYTWTAHIVSIR